MKVYKTYFTLIACLLFIIQSMYAQKHTMMRTNPKDQNVELGKVSWYRDYDTALALSKQENKPVLLFFQEIPGCSSCVNYGRNVLSHPLMVEFIENEFIPLAIYNNKPGKDAVILKRYNEPSWNNPVAHFIDANGKDIIKKLANNYEPLSMYSKLVEVLVTLKRPIPKYVLALKDDLKIKYGFFNQTIFETPCFWSGETTLAQHPAVKYTEAGWIDGKEVVKVFYDAALVTLEGLNTYAIKEGFYQISNHQNYKIDTAPQYYLSKSKFSYLPLSNRQRTLINVLIPYKGNPKGYLSPKQLEQYLKQDNTPKNNYKKPIQESWFWVENTNKVLG